MAPNTDKDVHVAACLYYTQLTPWHFDRTEVCWLLCVPFIIHRYHNHSGSGRRRLQLAVSICVCCSSCGGSIQTKIMFVEMHVTKSCVLLSLTLCPLCFLFQLFFLVFSPSFLPHLVPSFLAAGSSVWRSASWWRPRAGIWRLSSLSSRAESVNLYLFKPSVSLRNKSRQESTEAEFSLMK